MKSMIAYDMRKLSRLILNKFKKKFSIYLQIPIGFKTVRVKSPVFNREVHYSKNNITQTFCVGTKHRRVLILTAYFNYNPIEKQFPAKESIVGWRKKTHQDESDSICFNIYHYKSFRIGYGIGDTLNSILKTTKAKKV